MTDPLDEKKVFYREIRHQFEQVSLGSRSYFSRFWKKPDNPQKNISTRAFEIRPDAREFHEELTNILKKFSTDENVYPFVKEVVGPLLREIDQILVKLQNNMTHENVDKYGRWTEKARRWVDLSSRLDNGKLLLEVKNQIVSRTFDMIDRDILLIMQYRSAQNSMVDVSCWITHLEDLKSNPDIALDAIVSWKNGIDIARAKTVNKALESIDAG